MEPHVKLTFEHGTAAYLVVCGECHGEGKADPICSSCAGSGEGMSTTSTCHRCKGNGSLPEHCEDCDGTGNVPATLLDLAIHKLNQGTQRGTDEARDLLTEAISILHDSPRHRITHDALIEAQEAHALWDHKAIERCKRAAEIRAAARAEVVA